MWQQTPVSIKLKRICRICYCKMSIQGWGHNYNKDIRLVKQINLLLLM